MFNELLTDIHMKMVSRYPDEGCGFIYDNEFHLLHNNAQDKANAFSISKSEYLVAEQSSTGLQAVVHSHTDGNHFPSEEDMQTQLLMGVPWYIACVDAGRYVEGFWFGDAIDIAPMEGRPFRHGVHDCYNLLRDWYRINRGIVLPQFPRMDKWWEIDDNLFVNNFEEAGFSLIGNGDFIPKTIEEGDVFLGKVLGSVPNHCAIYLGGGLILHHLSDRLSRREPVYSWRKYITHVLRYDP